VPRKLLLGAILSHVVFTAVEILLGWVGTWIYQIEHRVLTWRKYCNRCGKTLQRKLSLCGINFNQMRISATSIWIQQYVLVRSSGCCKMC